MRNDAAGTYNDHAGYYCIAMNERRLAMQWLLIHRIKVRIQRKRQLRPKDQLHPMANCRR
jgi:hypothetical protein